jgi:N-acetylglucosamine-6-phosphate deacetylase
VTDERIDGCILTPRGFVQGTLTHARGRVTGIAGTPVDEARVRDEGRAFVLPGFIDTHVHGGGGADTMQGGDAIDRIARLHARHGTTALLATTMTAPLPDVERALRALGPACVTRAPGAARVLGVHLEGPYINPGKLGAQPDYVRPASIDEVRALSALARILLITLAPELPGNPRPHPAASRRRLSRADRTHACELRGGRRGARARRGRVHSPFQRDVGMHHRAPGIVGAALAHAQYAEIIPDLLHVHPGALHVALRAIPHLFCVTDSTAASGMPDGDYQLGSHRVTKCMGGVRLADGTLAGSTLTMDQALRNLVEALGLSVREASLRVSSHAADYLGLADRGRLAEGWCADVAVLDRDLALVRVIAEGEDIDLADAR